jgi:hypothetical protein
MTRNQRTAAPQLPAPTAPMALFLQNRQVGRRGATQSNRVAGRRPGVLTRRTQLNRLCFRRKENSTSNNIVWVPRPTYPLVSGGKWAQSPTNPFKAPLFPHQPPRSAKQSRFRGSVSCLQRELHVPHNPRGHASSVSRPAVCPFVRPAVYSSLQKPFFSHPKECHA